MPPERPRRIHWHLLAATIGAALLYVTVHRVGWPQVEQSAAAVGWWAVPIIALGGVRFAARSLAWRACAGEGAFRLKNAFAAALAGDAVGNLTPLGLLASEPTKVWFIRPHLRTRSAAISLAAENAFYVASVVAMLAVGATLFVAITSVPLAWRVGVPSGVASVLAGMVAALWVLRRTPGALSRAATRVARLTGRNIAGERLREMEADLYAVLSWPAARVARVMGWEILFHITAVTEVWLLLRLLNGADEARWTDALILESAGRFIVVAFKFIPYRLGVDEAGSAVVARALAMDPAIGVTLALVRRLRVLTWNAVGLALLATRRR